jgi:D-alanine-D-alanine ligase
MSNNLAREFSLPFVIKPENEGSSIGMTIVEKESDIINAIRKAFMYDDDILIEEYINGDDITVGILQDRPLPVVHIKPKAKFYSFEAKYTQGMSEYIVPAELPETVTKEAQRLAVLAHRAVGCRSFSRVDMILDKRDSSALWVLEINTIPGLTSTSLLPKAAWAMGMDFAQMCLRMVESALVGV